METWAQSARPLRQTAGTYNLSFLAAQRTMYYIGSGASQPISIRVDGSQVALMTPVDGTFRTYNTVPFALTAGSHTMTFGATDISGDKTTFVDDIALNNSVSNVARAK